MKIKPKEIFVNLPVVLPFEDAEKVPEFAANINTILHGKQRLKYDELGLLGEQHMALFYLHRNDEYHALREEFVQLIEQQEINVEPPLKSNSKNKKGFNRKGQILTINLWEMDDEFHDLIRDRLEDQFHKGYNKFYSEFNPSGKQDYSDTLTMKCLVDYWKEQSESNDYKESLEDFIKDYHLEADMWLINCGYDFTGVKEIIIDAG